MTNGPREIDLTKPSAARLYDLYLGGTHNYPVDRTFAARAIDLCPFLPEIARQNRGFLRRASRYVAKTGGIRQIIDIGSGVPTVQNVHEVVHAVDPECRVVYVDNDREAIVSSQQMLDGVANTIALHGDLRNPDSILDSDEVRSLIDFSQPVGLLVVAVLHFIGPDDQPLRLLDHYLSRLPAGSYFCASHGTADEVSPDARKQLEELENAYGSTANPATLRTKAEFEQFFNSLELVDPGVTYAADWQATERVPVDDPARPSLWAAVGRKP